MTPDARAFAELFGATSVADNTNRSFTPFTAARTSLVAWRMRETSASKSLGQGSAVGVSQSRVTVTLGAQSVTTFVGTQ